MCTYIIYTRTESISRFSSLVVAVGARLADDDAVAITADVPLRYVVFYIYFYPLYAVLFVVIGIVGAPSTPPHACLLSTLFDMLFLFVGLDVLPRYGVIASRKKFVDFCESMVYFRYRRISTR